MADILDNNATNAQDVSEDDTSSETATTATTSTEKRRPGRPPKRARKNLMIIGTGKGRGRPRNIDLSYNDFQSNDDDADDDVHDKLTLQKKQPHKKKSKRGRGRPKKQPNSDDESDEDEVERRPVGRPATGAINLNIAYTGRGKGRPKKNVKLRSNKQVSKQAPERNEITNSEGVLPPVKKRVGRPASGKIQRWTGPTGRTRGRPKVRIADNIAEINSISNGAMNNEIEADNNDAAVQSQPTTIESQQTQNFMNDTDFVLRISENSENLASEIDD